MARIQVGDTIPNFSVTTESGTVVTPDTMKGKKHILFFYPKDDSPGCTKEACSIRDNYKYFTRNNYVVYGVSPDKEKKHEKFITKYEFQFSLLADTEKEMINAFGLWGPKKFMGREIVGVYRTTVVVDENSVVTNIIDKVKTKEHGEQLIEELGLTNSRAQTL